MPEYSSSQRRQQLRKDIQAALRSVYMSHCQFLFIYDQTPLQAIVAFQKAPEVFGTLRGYLGKTTLAANHKRALRLAESLFELDSTEDAETVDQPR